MEEVRPFTALGEEKAASPGRAPLQVREVLRAGCQWSRLLHSYPNYKRVYHYYNIWSKQGIAEQIHGQLVRKVRQKAACKARPSAGSIDSQSVKTTQIGGEERGLDAGKLIKGRKRFILVDKLGLLLAVKVIGECI